MIEHITIATPGQGLHEITPRIARCVREAGCREGLCTIFIQHTSASLLIQENADPAARHDLEGWLNRLVQVNDPLYTHTMEGPDDMPSHIKSALTATTLGIPIADHRLVLGTWQGVFLWEHRHGRYQRRLTVHIGT